MSENISSVCKTSKPLRELRLPESNTKTIGRRYRSNFSRAITPVSFHEQVSYFLRSLRIPILATVSRARDGWLEEDMNIKISELLEKLDSIWAMSTTLPTNVRVGQHRFTSFSKSFIQQSLRIIAVLTSPDFGSTGTSPSNDEHRHCLDALFLTDPRADRERILSARGGRSKGTCEWITFLEEYKVWVAAKESSLLWISGQPGRGKTYLSIYLAETLANSKDAILLEYYCDNKDKERNTASAVVRGLMFGLLNQLPELSQCLSTGLDKDTHKLRDDSFAALWAVFNHMIQTSENPVVCVLDGLDECDNTSISEMVTSFGKISLRPASTKSYLKIALTSRPLPKANSAILNQFPHIMLDTKSEQGQIRTELDVGIFVEAEFREYFSQDFLTGYFRDVTEISTWCDKTKAKLIERAGGTFLWAGFAIKQLRDTSPLDVEEVLENLPEGLDGMYDRILRQIEETHKETQQKQIAALLRWVVVAVRPMSLGEISAAIPIGRKDGFRNETMVRDLVTGCKGLLVITDEIVYLVHQSVKDYLVSQDPDATPSRNLFCVKEKLAHGEIAQTCISYLQCGSLADPLLEGSYSSRHIIPAREVSFPLLSYSIFNWPAHARLSEQDIFDDKDSFFSRSSTVREAWLNAYWNLTWPADHSESFSLLHIGAFFNLLVLMKQLVKSGWFLIAFFSKSNLRDGGGRTPLWWAAKQGHEDAAKLLLENGAEIDAKDNEGRTPLSLAVQGGYEALGKLLLEKGAAVDAKSTHGKTPLFFAAGEGHEASARLLLEKGAAVDAKDNDNQTPLSLAAQGRHEAMVKLLLKKGATVNVKPNDGRTPLWWTAAGGSEGLARLLVENGAGVDIEDNGGRTPLSVAAQEGHEAIGRLLLANGAAVDAKSNGRHISFARLHFELRAGVDSEALKAKHGRTPLQWAVSSSNKFSARGREALARLLIEKGAALDVKIYGRTLLLLTATGGSEALVRVLVEKDAVVDAQDDNGRTPLSVAAQEGHEAIGRLLLENGAAVDAKDKNGRTPLWWAARLGHEGATKLLLENGAAVDSKDDDGRTPLSLACEESYEVLERLLLEKGATASIIVRQ